MTLLETITSLFSSSPVADVQYRTSDNSLETSTLTELTSDVMNSSQPSTKSIDNLTPDTPADTPTSKKKRRKKAAPVTRKKQPNLTAQNTYRNSKYRHITIKRSSHPRPSLPTETSIDSPNTDASPESADDPSGRKGGRIKLNLEPIIKPFYKDKAPQELGDSEDEHIPQPLPPLKSDGKRGVLKRKRVLFEERMDSDGLNRGSGSSSESLNLDQLAGGRENMSWMEKVVEKIEIVLFPKPVVASAPADSSPGTDTSQYVADSDVAQSSSAITDPASSAELMQSAQIVEEMLEFTDRGRPKRKVRKT